MCGIYTEDEVNKIKNSKFKMSVGEWMIENLGEDAVSTLWSDRNQFSPFEISIRSRNKVYINCTNTDYHGECLVYASSLMYTDCKCAYCSRSQIHPLDSFAKWAIDNIDINFFNNYWSSKNTLNPWEIGVGTKEKVWLICQEKEYHDEYEIRIDHIYRGCGCPYCSSRKTHKLDSLGQYLTENKGVGFIDTVWSNKNTKSIFEIPINSGKLFWWKCPCGKHEDFKRSACKSSVRDYRCPICVAERKESFLQEKVRLYVSDVLRCEIFHEHQTNIQCYNDKTKQKLPYDNEVFINNDKLIIEVHGEQHYKINAFTTSTAKKQKITPEEALAYQQWKDQYKKEYALSQGYYYLEIPHWTNNEQEEWKELIDNKIKEILHNK